MGGGAEQLAALIQRLQPLRKGLSDSVIEAVAGTGGIAAAVDTLWQLKRKPEGEATLDVVGRETEERILAMRFDREPLGWRILGDDDAQPLNSERRQVLDYSTKMVRSARHRLQSNWASHVQRYRE
jgi:hypothetical protein